MSVRRIDARFLLPGRVGRAIVLGDLGAWREGLEAAGVEVADSGDADVVVAPSALAREARDGGAPALLLEGRDPRKALAGSGYAIERFAALPSVERPEIFVPLDRPEVASYALRSLSVPRQRWKKARNDLVGRALRRGLLPPTRSLVTVGVRESAPPEFVAGALRLGIPASDWLLTLGEGDETRRGVFHLFEQGAPRPSWAVKFSRIPGLDFRFDMDERAMALVEEAGGAVAAHAPRLLGRFGVDSLSASVETAAPGTRLTNVLLSSRARAEKLEILERAAHWLIDVARETAGPPAALAPERERLEQLLRAGTRWRTGPELVTSLPPVAPVLQHNDLGTTNVIVDGESFVAIDWEDALRHGMPLWDVVYLLSDGLALVDRVPTLDGGPRAAHFRRLFRGELDTSPLLFRAIRDVAAASALPDDAVGAVVWLCWIDLEPWLAHTWADDPELGAAWSAWRA